jgi:hypothetical protein
MPAGSRHRSDIAAALRRGCLAFAALWALATEALAADTRFIGLLRARDLTPFGFLRLDMRPAHAVEDAPTWVVETELAYQNTWALSPEVERYLTDQGHERRELGPAELADLRALPGENYLVDVELAQLDVTMHRRLSPVWSAYLILSGAAYNGGILDSTIEQFHDTFGFSTFGRTATARNDVNVIFDLKSSQFSALETPTSGGLLDPTVGIRYVGKGAPGWRLVLESAMKIPVAGRRTLLSTGRMDVGVQATLQRFSVAHAFYASLSGVYYAGSAGALPSRSQIVPTIVAGYERRFTTRTNAILQAHASPSVFTRTETDLDELLDYKYQLSLGVRHHRRDGHLVSFAITENLQNLNNTPDVGLQLGWTYIPAGGRVRPPR